MPVYVSLVFFVAAILSVGALGVGIVISLRRKAAVATRIASDPVYAIARRVRRAFEQIAKREGRSESLAGLCGRAAVQFCLAAEKANLPVKLVHGDGHAYSRLPDNTIVDLTATQFNGYPDAPPDGYGSVEIAEESSGRYPDKWYGEDDSWDTVAEWLEATKDLDSSYHYKRNLYGARQRWEEDRKVVEETA